MTLDEEIRAKCESLCCEMVAKGLERAGGKMQGYAQHDVPPADHMAPSLWAVLA